MSEFEEQLIAVASQCEIAYGAMGATGFLYASVKNQLRWHDMSRRTWTHSIMQIGAMLVADDQYWNKIKLSIKRTPQSIATALIAAFGDGKKEEN